MIFYYDHGTLIYIYKAIAVLRLFQMPLQRYL